MIAAVLFLALVNITTFETVDLVPLEAFLARTYYGTVHCCANVLAATIMVSARIERSAGSIPRFMIRWTFTAEGAHGVNALVITSAVVTQALVDIDASLLVVL